MYLFTKRFEILAQLWLPFAVFLNTELKTVNQLLFCTNSLIILTVLSSFFNFFFTLLYWREGGPEHPLASY